MKRFVALMCAAVATTACDQLATKPLNYTSVEVRAERRLGGAPIAGVPVVLFTGPRPMGYDTTDALGRARFDLVPTGGVQLYGVLSYAPAGYEFPERLLGGPPSDRSQSMTLVHDSTSRVTFKFLKVGPGTITARIVDGSGAGFANADVELYTQGAVLRQAKSRADGNVSFDAVPFGVYGVSVPRPAPYRDIDEAPRTLVDGLMIEDGVTVPAGTFLLQRCQGTINLSVTDITRGAVPGLQTYLYIPSGVIDSALTSSDGKVRYVTPLCESYGVRIVGTDEWRVIGGRGTEWVESLMVRRGSTHDVTFAVNTCRGAVRASVVDEAGAAVPNATITLYSTSPLEPNVVTVATTGTLTFNNLRCAPPVRGVYMIPPAGWTLAPSQPRYFADGLVVTKDATLDVKFILARIATP